MDAKSILAIPTIRPERLYPNDLALAKSMRNQLVKQWHPDICKDAMASNVVEHVQKLYDAVVAKIVEGKYGKNTTRVNFTKISGGDVVFDYLVKQSFTIGTIYYNKTEVLWHILPEYRKIASRHSLLRTAISNLPNKNYKTLDLLTQTIPASQIQSVENGFILTALKSREYLLLENLVDRFSPEHVGWALNRIYEQLTLFHDSGIYVGDISPYNVWLCPASHRMLMLNGFWFGGADGLNQEMVPTYALKLLPIDIIKTNPKLLDQHLVKRLGRLLLGDASGMGLKMNGKVPKPMTTFLTSDPLNGVSQDHLAWKKVLQTCFGDPKFIEMNVDIEQIYGD